MNARCCDCLMTRPGPRAGRAREPGEVEVIAAARARLMLSATHVEGEAGLMQQGSSNGVRRKRFAAVARRADRAFYNGARSGRGQGNYFAWRQVQQQGRSTTSTGSSATEARPCPRSSAAKPPRLLRLHITRAAHDHRALAPSSVAASVAPAPARHSTVLCLDS